MNRRELFRSMFAIGAIALVPSLPALPLLSKAASRKPRQLTLEDLVRMRERGEPISQTLLESVRHYENKHLDFGPCDFCSATTFKQHAEWCDRASILWEENWYEVVKGWEQLVPRVAVLKHADGRVSAKTLASQTAAIAWLRTQYRSGSGDVIEIHPQGVVADGYLRRSLCSYP